MAIDPDELDEDEAEDLEEEDLELEHRHGRRGVLRPRSPGLVRLFLRVLLGGFRVRGHPPRRRR